MGFRAFGSHSSSQSGRVGDSRCPNPIVSVHVGGRGSPFKLEFSLSAVEGQTRVGTQNGLAIAEQATTIKLEEDYAKEKEKNAELEKKNDELEAESEKLHKMLRASNDGH